MIWLLDAGNTQVKAAEFDSGKPPEGAQTVLYPEFRQWAEALSPADQFFVSCVAANSHREDLTAILGPRAEWVATVPDGLGIRCAYEDHRKWGVDRWLALAAVYNAGSRSCGSAVVDIGTATTFDICNAQGEHLGGWIAPGPVALLEALGKGRTSLPQAAADLPQRLGLARDTEEALTHGALHCAVGCIRAALDSAKEEGIAEVVLSGGGVEALAQYLPSLVPKGQMRIEHNLVLRGLWLYAQSRL